MRVLVPIVNLSRFNHDVDSRGGGGEFSSVVPEVQQFYYVGTIVI